MSSIGVHGCTCGGYRCSAADCLRVTSRASCPPQLSDRRGVIADCVDSPVALWFLCLLPPSSSSSCGSTCPCAWRRSLRSQSLRRSMNFTTWSAQHRRSFGCQHWRESTAGCSPFVYVRPRLVIVTPGFHGVLGRRSVWSSHCLCEIP